MYQEKIHVLEEKSYHTRANSLDTLAGEPITVFTMMQETVDFIRLEMDDCVAVSMMK